MTVENEVIPENETVSEELESNDEFFVVEEESHGDLEVSDAIPTLPTLSDIADTMETKMGSAPVITEEVGLVERAFQVESLRKVGYYAVFGPKEHQSTEVGSAIKGVHIARFETKAHLKKVIMSLDEKGFKLIDILKGRPLAFSVVSRKVHDISIGD